MENVYYCKSFSNLASFAAYLDTARVNSYFAGRSLESQGPGRAYFYGTDSYESSLALMKNGDRENAAKVTAAAGVDLKQPVKQDGTRARRIHAVCGGAVNVGAAVLNLPRSMYRTTKVTFENGSKVLNICYNGNVANTVTAEEKIKVSAALAGAVLALENKGYRVNLYTSCTAYANIGKRPATAREYIGNFVKIKDSAQYFDLLKLVFPLVNPSFQRRLSFRFRETFPAELRGREWNMYGFSVTDSETVKRCAAAAGLVLKKVVTFYEIQDRTPEQIAEMLLN